MLRDGDMRVLTDYDLTGPEEDRILDIIRQPGILVSCSLSRGNRLESIFSSFPMTCVLLQPVLRQLLDALWEQHRPDHYQLAGEETAFAAMIEKQIAAGQLSMEYLQEVFSYEMVCVQLVRRIQTGTDRSHVEAVVEFQHSPDEILPR